MDNDGLKNYISCFSTKNDHSVEGRLKVVVILSFVK